MQEPQVGIPATSCIQNTSLSKIANQFMKKIDNSYQNQHRFIISTWVTNGIFENKNRYYVNELDMNYIQHLFFQIGDKIR